MAKGKIIDRAMVDLVLSMKERNPALTTAQIGQVLNCDATTAGRIISCGSWEAYCAWKDEKARKEREKNRKAAEEQAEEPQREPEVPGQICMELDNDPWKEKNEEFNRNKLIRFQAAQVDKLIMKLDQLNNTMSMILRAVRKE